MVTINHICCSSISSPIFKSLKLRSAVYRPYRVSSVSGKYHRRKLSWLLSPGSDHEEVRLSPMMTHLGKKKETLYSVCVCACTHARIFQHEVACSLSSQLRKTQLPSFYWGYLQYCCHYFPITLLSSHLGMESEHNNGQVRMQSVVRGKQKSMCMDI